MTDIASSTLRAVESEESFGLSPSAASVFATASPQSADGDTADRQRTMEEEAEAAQAAALNTNIPSLDDIFAVDIGGVELNNKETEKKSS